MNYNSAKDLISTYLPDYLSQKGIDTRKPFCCLNPDHPDETPSMVYDKSRNKCHCFSCGTDVDIFNIISWDYGTTNFMETLNKACDIFGINLDNRKASNKPLIKPVQKENIYKKTKKAEKAEELVCDKVYKALKQLSPLTEKDKKYLSEVRGLKNDRISKDYFRLVTETEQKTKIIKNIKKLTGLSNDDIKYVPGFFIHAKTKELDYYSTSGIGILLHNEYGKVTAVQIRKDSADKGKRYCWFTSSFAVDNEDFDGGSSPGAAKDILIPSNPKNCLCLTEGRFKAEILAQHKNLVISLQGATTWKGVDENINNIMEEYNIKTICLMFDSDVMGNNQLLRSLSELLSMLNEKFPNIKIIFGIWRIQYGKGIDDCILSGNMHNVKFINANYFVSVCKKSLHELMRKYNLQSLKSLRGDAQKKFFNDLQLMNENKLIPEYSQITQLNMAK